MNFLNAMPGAIAQGLIWGIMAIGLFISYKVLDFADLTVDGSICTGGAVCTVLILADVNIAVAILVAVIAGMACGLITGFFHTVMGIPAILSGILTQLALWSINLKILGQANRAININSFSVLIAQLQIPKAIGVMVGVAVGVILILYWLFGTKLGSSIRATGCNENMARAQGINTNLNKILGLMISNGLVALSGALLCQYQGFCDINMGRGAIVIGLAAIIIGGAVVSKISTNFAVQMTGVMLGSIIYYLVYQLIVFLGLDTDLLKLLTAIMVGIFLSIPYLKKKFAPTIHARIKNGKKTTASEESSDDQDTNDDNDIAQTINAEDADCANATYENLTEQGGGIDA